MTVTFDFGLLAPVLVVGLAAVGVLVIDAALPRLGRAHWWLATVVLLVATVLSAHRWIQIPHRGDGTLCGSGYCAYGVDRVVLSLQLAITVSALVVVLLISAIPAPVSRAPVQVALLLSATAGGLIVCASRDAASWLIALELATLPTVGLVALRARRSAIDGSLALLVSALTSFALAAMGVALWYAATGSLRFDQTAALHAIADSGRSRVLILAIMLLLAGVAFKLSLAPFHAWTPDTFAGASIPVSAYLAVTSKVAAVGALIVVIRSLTGVGGATLSVIGLVSVLSMTLGNLMALRERRMLRLLAWSTVAQAGWVVMPLAPAGSAAVGESVRYVLMYALATLLVFAVVTAVAHARGRDAALDLGSYNGLARSRPVLGWAMAFALLTLAGVPPALLGVAAKVAAVGPVVAAHLWWLAVAAAINTMIGLAVYLRWILAIVIRDGRGPATDVQPAAVRDTTGGETEAIAPVHSVVVLALLLGLLVASVWPQVLFALPG